MRKIFNVKNLLATMLALAVLLCSFPAVYAGEVIPEIPAEEIALEALTETAPETAETEEVPAAEPETAEAAEAEEVREDAPAAAATPEEVPEEAPAAAVEPEEVPEEVPAADAKPEEVPEEVSAADVEPEEVPEEVPAAAVEDEAEDSRETGSDEEYFEDEDLFEIDEDDAGSVSEELLEEFNNPETYETAVTDAAVEIVLKNSELHYGGDVTLAARVSGVDMNCRIVWEASDGDERGWFTVGSGPEYTFVLTSEIVEREYRVVLFSVD